MLDGNFFVDNVNIPFLNDEELKKDLQEYLISGMPLIRTKTKEKEKEEEEEVAN